MMHPAINRLGFRHQNAEIADSFIRACIHLGVAEKEAVAAVEWFARAYGPGSNITIDDLSPAFQYAAGRYGWSDKLVQAGIDWWAAMDSAGGDPAAIRPL